MDEASIWLIENNQMLAQTFGEHYSGESTDLTSLTKLIKAFNFILQSKDKLSLLTSLANTLEECDADLKRHYDFLYMGMNTDWSVNIEELISIMMEIRDQLIGLNSKMNILTGHGSNSLSDITEAIESIKGSAGYDLSDINSSMESIKGSTGYDLTDILSSLSNVESSLSSIDLTLTTKD